MHTRHVMRSEGKCLTMAPGKTFHGPGARDAAAAEATRIRIDSAALRVAVAEHNDDAGALQRLRGRLTAPLRSRRAHLAEYGRRRVAGAAEKPATRAAGRAAARGAGGLAAHVARCDAAPRVAADTSRPAFSCSGAAGKPASRKAAPTRKAAKRARRAGAAVAADPRTTQRADTAFRAEPELDSADDTSEDEAASGGDFDSDSDFQ